MKRTKGRDSGLFGQYSLKCTCTSAVAMIAGEDQCETRRQGEARDSGLHSTTALNDGNHF